MTEKYYECEITQDERTKLFKLTVFYYTVYKTYAKKEWVGEWYYKEYSDAFEAFVYLDLTYNNIGYNDE